MAGMTLSPFLALPLELRDQIYDLLLHPAYNRTEDTAESPAQYHFDLRILEVNRQIQDEAKKVFRRHNAFVRIESPFAESVHHIAVEGHVPIVKTNVQAERFMFPHLVAKIQSPHLVIPYGGPFVILVHVDDVRAFCQFWFYSAVSYPDLNSHLGLDLELKNPYAGPDDDSPVPKALQKKCLEPFGLVKSLHTFSIKGNPYPSIEKALRQEMNAPYESPESCLERAAKHKEAGNQAFKLQDYEKAIHCYQKSFEAIYIICVGRRRQVWGDAFFTGQLMSGQFEGQEANMVRLVMRIQLVANIVYCFNMMEEWAEAQFWGSRTINILRQALGLTEENEEAYQGFPAATEMGKIYYRTGLACKNLKDPTEARRLLRIAKQYLPQDQAVDKALALVALRI